MMRMLRLFLSTTMVGAVLASCAPAQHSVVAESAQKLMISGHLTMRERIALSPLAAAELTLIDASDPSAPVLGRQRIPFNGGQVPIAFNLALEQSRLRAGGSYILRGTIRDGDPGLGWAVDTPVDAGQGLPRLDVGTLVVVRDQLPSTLPADADTVPAAMNLAGFLSLAAAI